MSGKVFLALGLAVAATSVLVSPARATLLVSDPFSYADGDLVGNTPPTGGGAWATHSGTTGPVQVSGGKISIVQASTATQDVNVPLGVTAAAGSKFYTSFDLTVADPGGTVSSAYFAHFMQGTSNFDARLWITAPTAAGYRLALSNDSSITDADGEVFTGDLAFGQTYKVVTSYDYDAKAASIWIDPTSEASASLAATDPGFSDAVTAYAFRQSNAGATQVVDNLKIGTTFGDVAGAPLPEPASVGFLAGACLVGLARRRRHA